MAIEFKGLSTVLLNLNKEIAKIQGGTKAGLIEAGMMIKNKAGKYTPIGDTGNLLGSAYTIPTGTKMEPSQEIGYTAAYAVFVHEIDKHYRRPGSSWKFLERALKENTRRILQIIASRTRV